MNFLILYGTTEGQTRKIAGFVGERIRAGGHTTLIMDATDNEAGYLKLGEFDMAIDDFTAALKINPKIANALYGRSLAKRKKGDESGADSDLAAAKAVYTGIVAEFWHYGIE